MGASYRCCHYTFYGSLRSVSVSLICLCLCFCLSLSVCLSVSVSLSLFVSVCLSACLSVCLSVCLCLSLSLFHSLSFSFSLSLSLSPSLSLPLSFFLSFFHSLSFSLPLSLSPFFSLCLCLDMDDAMLRSLDICLQSNHKPSTLITFLLQFPLCQYDEHIVACAPSPFPFCSSLRSAPGRHYYSFIICSCHRLCLDVHNDNNLFVTILLSYKGRSDIRPRCSVFNVLVRI